MTVTAVVELACNWCGRCLASTAPPGAPPNESSYL